MSIKKINFIIYQTNNINLYFLKNELKALQMISSNLFETLFLSSHELKCILEGY